MTELYWLPEVEEWRARLRALAGAAPAASWAEAVALANTRLDFVRTNALDQIVARRFGPPGAETGPPPGLATGLAAKPVRLALLGSGTMAHLHAAIRVAGLRRGLWITIYENDYGQYWQELSDPNSALHAFRPNAVLLALDPYHLTAGLGAASGAAEAAERAAEWRDRLRQCWSLAKEAFRCPVLHQTPLPVHPARARASSRARRTRSNRGRWRDCQCQPRRGRRIRRNLQSAGRRRRCARCCADR